MWFKKKTKKKHTHTQKQNKTKQFPRFPSFGFCPILKIENWEISESSESFMLLKCLVVYGTQNQKNDL